jgi:hypothetical protein
VRGRWAAALLPRPSNAAQRKIGVIQAIHCSNSTACTAVGGYLANDGNVLPLVDTEIAGAWSAVSPALPASDTGSAWLEGVWCASQVQCVAVGWPEAGAAFEVTELSGIWQQGNSLPRSSGILPLSVACTSSVSNCAAIGISPTLSGSFVPFGFTETN